MNLRARVSTMHTVPAARIIPTTPNKIINHQAHSAAYSKSGKINLTRAPADDLHFWAHASTSRFTRAALRPAVDRPRSFSFFRRSTTRIAFASASVSTASAASSAGASSLLLDVRVRRRLVVDAFDEVLLLLPLRPRRLAGDAPAPSSLAPSSSAQVLKLLP